MCYEIIIWDEWSIFSNCNTLTPHAMHTLSQLIVKRHWVAPCFISFILAPVLFFIILLFPSWTKLNKVSRFCSWIKWKTLTNSHADLKEDCKADIIYYLSVCAIWFNNHSRHFEVYLFTLLCVGLCFQMSMDWWVSQSNKTMSSSSIFLVYWVFGLLVKRGG